MHAKLFEAALGVTAPWHVVGVDFDVHKKVLTLRIDLPPGHRFSVAGLSGAHPVHDTFTKRYRHLNFFQHECYLEVQVPRVRLPDGGIRQMKPKKAEARMIHMHLEGIVDWARTQQTHGFLEAINSLFQAAKRKARGHASFSTIRTALFLIVGKLDFARINPHAA